MSTTKQFIKKYWSPILAGIGAALVIICIILLTTRTDALSTAESGKSINNTIQEAININEDSETATNTEEIAGRKDDFTFNSPSPENELEKGELSQPADPFDISIEARSAIVWDIKNHVAIYEKNANKELPLASLTKVMTALVGAQMANETGVNETVISRQHLDALGSSGLVAGQTWNIYDLISFMLIESSNDAARAVAAAATSDQADGYAKDFVERMNDTAKSLGLESTYFFNPSGLDLNETLISGGYGSARDIAELFSYTLETNKNILTPTIYANRVFQSVEGVNYSAENTNTWLQHFPEALGSKTGYTVLAGGNLVMAFEFDRPTVIVVMGSTQTGRFHDMQKLYNASKQYFKEKSVADGSF